MNIAVDIDGTITRCPELFAVLCEGIRKKRGKVFIITSREASPDVERQTKQELGEMGIVYDELFIIRGEKQKPIPCPHRELDWYRKYLWQKVRICLDHKVEAVFEDSQKVIDLFRQYAPGICVFQIHGT